MTTTTTPTSDERMFAALAHGSVIFSFFGPIGSIIVWLMQRCKSKYATFHALQAMGFQVFSFWLWILMSILFPLLFLVLLVPGMFLLEGTQYFEIFPIVFQAVFFIGIFGIWGLYFLFGLIGAGFCIAGKEFRYPILGKWLAKYLHSGDADGVLSEEREDSWVAAVCHATSTIFMWGIAVPVIVWFTQKARSFRLGFQAIQAAVYQGIAVVAYFIGMAFYLFLIFVMMATLFLGGAITSEPGADMPAWAGMGFFIGMISIALFWLVALIVIPAYYIVSGRGSIRILRGHDFRYPLIGRMIARKINYSPASIKKNAEE
jgi:uncharacterized Tic20 family protein